MHQKERMSVGKESMMQVEHEDLRFISLGKPLEAIGSS
jgi:hypothetical protein